MIKAINEDKGARVPKKCVQVSYETLEIKIVDSFATKQTKTS